MVNQHLCTKASVCRRDLVSARVAHQGSLNIPDQRGRSLTSHAPAEAMHTRSGIRTDFCKPTGKQDTSQLTAGVLENSLSTTSRLDRS